MSQLWQFKKKSDYLKNKEFDSTINDTELEYEKRVLNINKQTRNVAVNPLKFMTQSHGGLNLIVNSNTPFKWIKEVG